ncbi:TIGR04282 family arsenosugar biosynthesis glycosyltransferase [Terrabacter sp. C0L_2]|jgi:glycosyltransferase A (GT-A) superfamily protein (DUF2064 family)|uniref:TIGR04282 family arsenosugar biosynthesis glycosyltransferase n=1 Tax=Terrabacter sp. C0L_2 TaxID=3108389 RepID=UPI002ED2E559|nr:DUF2064 domain-containing protein [Terrabacter sp. C0L_2]
MTTLAVVAKECVPGRVKTRLCPPLTPAHAALVARAALTDTLNAVRRAGGRPLLYLDGVETDCAADGFEVMTQCDGPLDVRLAHLLDACEGPTVLIGMDTPQVDARLLRRLASEPWPDDVDAWFGAAADGGFWLLGLREPTGDVVRGVPMSLASTGDEVRGRLDAAGLRTRDVPVLVDVDTAAEAVAVAAAAPRSRFAAQWHASIAELSETAELAGAARATPGSVPAAPPAAVAS